jgi:hypothetical protein
VTCPDCGAAGCTCACDNMIQCPKCGLVSVAWVIPGISNKHNAPKQGTSGTCNTQRVSGR